MGFRFSKRISIMPGVRLNLSKSGASWSLGPRGASVSIGKRGVYGNVGLAGTGLSYRQRLDTPKRAAPRAERTAKPQLPERVIARLDGNQVVLLDPEEQQLDPALVPAAKRLMRTELESFLSDVAAERNAELEALCNLHHDIPNTVGMVRTSNAGKPDRDHYFDQQSYVQALMQWRAAQANAGPDEAATCDALLETLGGLAWPAETNIALALENGRLLLDVDLPELEDMPDATWQGSFARLELERKAMTRKDRLALYLDHVCSIVLRLTGHAFAVSGNIAEVAVSAYTQRSGSIGVLQDEYVVTVAVSRAQWANIDLQNISQVEPHQCLRKLGAKIETDARGKLLVQQPLS